MTKNLNQKNSTFSRRSKFLRAFAKWLIDKGHILRKYESPIDFPKVKVMKKPVMYLSALELRKLLELELDEYSAMVRDAFLFACFSGLRFSDLKGLTWSNVHFDSKCFQIIVTKTRQPLTVPLNNVTLCLLLRYNSLGRPNGNKVFSLTSNCSYNRALKRICYKAGMTELVSNCQYRNINLEVDTSNKYKKMSSHIARKTFACNCIEQSVDLKTTMELMGITCVKTMDSYMAVSAPHKKVSMEKLNNILDSSLVKSLVNKVDN